jgi:predicted GIY-YIG superfamily endonuclease
MARCTLAFVTTSATVSHCIAQGVARSSSENTASPVYVDTYASPSEVIAREKALKEWHRDWKIRLIEQDNPDWRDLSHLL